MLVGGCLTDDLLAGRRVAPCGVIYQDEFWQLMHCGGPVVLPGYLMLVLCRHREHLAELTPSEAAALGPLIHATCLALGRVRQSARVYVTSWGDGVRHVHFHLIPRLPEMPTGNLPVALVLGAKSWLARLGVRWAVEPDEAAAIVAARVRAELRRLGLDDG